MLHQSSRMSFTTDTTSSPSTFNDLSDSRYLYLYNKCRASFLSAPKLRFLRGQFATIVSSCHCFWGSIVSRITMSRIFSCMVVQICFSQPSGLGSCRILIARPRSASDWTPWWAMPCCANCKIYKNLINNDIDFVWFHYSLFIATFFYQIWILQINLS